DRRPCPVFYPTRAGAREGGYAVSPGAALGHRSSLRDVLLLSGASRGKMFPGSFSRIGGEKQVWLSPSTSQNRRFIQCVTVSRSGVESHDRVPLRPQQYLYTTH